MSAARPSAGSRTSSTEPPSRRRSTKPEPEPDAWRRIRVTLDWPREVAGRLLALGGAVEVMAPPELRTEIAALAAETVARYREPVTAGSTIEVAPTR